MGRKMISTGWGVGVEEFLGEDTTKGTKDKDQGLRTEVARVGDWRVVIWASDLRLLLLCAREGNNLQTTCGGANGDLRTMGFVVSHPSPSARRMGHPHFGKLKVRHLPATAGCLMYGFSESGKLQKLEWKRTRNRWSGIIASPVPKSEGPGPPATRPPIQDHGPPSVGRRPLTFKTIGFS